MNSIPRLFLPLLSAALLLLAGCAHLFRAAPDPAPDITGLGKVHIYYHVPAGTEPGAKTFHVFRSEDHAGPFQRVTREPVRLPEDAAPGQPARLWTDYGLRLGEDYYYYLQELRDDGTARKATGTGRSRVTIPLQDADVPALIERRELAGKL